MDNSYCIILYYLLRESNKSSIDATHNVNLHVGFSYIEGSLHSGEQGSSVGFKDRCLILL